MFVFLFCIGCIVTYAVIIHCLHCESKNIVIMSITSRKIDRLSRFFTDRLRTKFCTK